MKPIHLILIAFILTTIVFTVSTIDLSNKLSKKSEIIDSLNFELSACDTENVILATVLQEIKENDSVAFNKALNNLIDEN